jgi:hypothetical protein
MVASTHLASNIGLSQRDDLSIYLNEQRAHERFC